MLNFTNEPLNDTFGKIIINSVRESAPNFKPFPGHMYNSMPYEPIQQECRCQRIRTTATTRTVVMSTPMIMPTVCPSLCVSGACRIVFPPPTSKCL